MNFFVVLASLVMALHLLFILWVVFGALLTHRRPLLRWLHLASLVWGTVVEILPWVSTTVPQTSTCLGHRLSGWISPPLFGRAGLSRCPARPADRLRRRGLPIQS